MVCICKRFAWGLTITPNLNLSLLKKNRLMCIVNLSFVCTLYFMAMLSYKVGEGNCCSYIQIGFIKLEMFLNLVAP